MLFFLIENQFYLLSNINKIYYICTVGFARRLTYLNKNHVMEIHIINGPNLNLLGKREPSIYGDSDFESYLKKLQSYYKTACNIIYYQSNHEGSMIDKIHEIGFESDGIILNAGAYTHTSIALHDAIKAITVPVIEVHISNIHTREEFRHKSMIAPACIGSVLGFGFDSYRLALEHLLNKKTIL